MIQMYLLDLYETDAEKARRELPKKTVGCFQQILGAEPDKTTAVRPLTSHLTNHPSKTSKAC